MAALGSGSMGARPDGQEQWAGNCPFLLPPIADQLSAYPPVGGCRRPDGSLRILAAGTVGRLCAGQAYLACPGYRAATGMGGVAP